MVPPADGPCTFVTRAGGGELRWHGAFRHGRHDGLWRVTDEKTGETLWEVTWAGGKWHGPSRSWYPNGRLQQEGHYENGFMTGLWTFWFPSGEIAARGRYERDRKSGVWEYFDEGGAVVEHGTWERDFGFEYDFAYDDYTGLPRGENWPRPEP